MASLSVSATVPVAAPAARAWELLCDSTRYAEWVEGTDAVTRTDGPARQGSTYDEVNPIAGPWKGRSRWTVTEFEPPRRMLHHGEGIAPTVDHIDTIMEVASVGDDACEVTIALRGESALGPAGALMFKALGGQVDSDNRRSAENFAALVAREAGAGATAR